MESKEIMGKHFNLCQVSIEIDGLGSNFGDVKLYENGVVVLENAGKNKDEVIITHISKCIISFKGHI